MSEIILEYAEEVLELASTPEGMKRAMLLAISAWNLSLIKENRRRDKAIAMFIRDVMKINKNSDQWKEMLSVVQTLIEKRMTEYPEVNRFIFDYEFIHINKNNFHLNVISSLDAD